MLSCRGAGENNQLVSEPDSGVDLSLILFSLEVLFCRGFRNLHKFWGVFVAVIWAIMKSMRRDELILAAMAPGGGYEYTPVQVQKLLFLIDRQIPEHVGGPHFHFEPYHYGPFDRNVYTQLDLLASRGLVHIDPSLSPRRFALTMEGLVAGNAALNTLTPLTQDFIARTCQFVRTQSFSSLVSAIYKAFPDMRVNSVFQE